MIKLPSVTICDGASYITIANALPLIGNIGTYIVYAKGNPKTLYKLLEAEGILAYPIYMQLENFTILKNHAEVICTNNGAILYKYKRKEIK